MQMKKYIAHMISSLLLIVCSDYRATPTSPSNAYTCSPSFRYSFLKKTCIPLFSIADIQLLDPTEPSHRIYILLSENRFQAEVFSTKLSESSMLLEAVKGGYISKDGKVRLLKKAEGWKIYYE